LSLGSYNPAPEALQERPHKMGKSALGALLEPELGSKARHSSHRPETQLRRRLPMGRKVLGQFEFVRLSWKYSHTTFGIFEPYTSRRVFPCQWPVAST
jgi:hypothetical protein